MPPKGKKKSKQGNHPPPQESRQVIRRREQEKKKDAKRLARYLKNLKKEEKRKKTASSTGCDKDNQESSQHQTGGESVHDINLPHSSCKEPSTSGISGQQTNLQKESNEKTENVCCPETGLPLVQQKASEKYVTESKELGRNIDKAEQVESQNIPPDNSVRKKSQRQKTKRQVKNEKKEIVKKGSKKHVEVVDLASNTPKSASNVQRKAAENVTNDINLHKQDLFKVKTINCLDENTRKLLPFFQEKKLAIKGVIKVQETEQSVKSDKGVSTYSIFFEDTRMLYLGDEDVKVAIYVDEGNQVVCNSRRRREMDLNQNAKPCSGSQEDQATAKLDKDIKTDSEKHDETASEAECDSSCKDFSIRNRQTVVDQLTDNLEKLDSEKHENLNDAKRNVSKENDSSDILSVREMVHKVCSDYLMDLYSTCGKFATRVQNQIKGNSLNSTEILKNNQADL